MNGTNKSVVTIATRAVAISSATTSFLFIGGLGGYCPRVRQSFTIRFYSAYLVENQQRVWLLVSRRRYSHFTSTTLACISPAHPRQERGVADGRLRYESEWRHHFLRRSVERTWYCRFCIYRLPHFSECRAVSTEHALCQRAVKTRSSPSVPPRKVARGVRLVPQRTMCW